jgi:hypothetical protein
VLSLVDEQNTGVEHWWNDTEKEKLKQLKRKCVSGPLVPPQIPHNEENSIDY